MRLRMLLTGLTVAALTVTALQAQTRPVPREDRDAARVQMPWPGRVSMIGVRLSDVTAEHVKTLKLSKMEGAIVESVNPNSPAAAAGLREKDVIFLFDGERVRSASHLTRLVAETPGGREVMLSVTRDGRQTDLRITPEETRGWFDPRFGGIIDSEEWRERMKEVRRAARELGQHIPEAMEGVREGMAMPSRAHLGVNVQSLTGDLPEYFGVTSGVLVASVTPGSPAAKAGLRAGDVITAVNGKAVASPRDLVGALPSGEGSHEVTLSVVREKQEMSTLVRLFWLGRPLE